MTIRLACHTIAFHSFPFAYAAKKIAQIGYDGIELNAETNWAQPHVTPKTPKKERQAMMEIVRECGLEVSSMCAHISLIDPSFEKRKKAIQFTKECIEIGLEFGTKIVHVVSGNLDKEVDRKVALGWLVSGLSELIDFSEDRGVKVAFEAAVNQLVANSNDLSDIINDLGSKRLYVNFDPSHFVLYGEDTSEAVAKFADRLVHVHAKDARGNPDHFEFPPLGAGVVDFRDLIRVLKAIEYGGFISVEYEGELFGYGSDPVSATIKSRSFLRDLIDSG
ncbi:MAG: sugar phosphate isomerase/epimerase family protein [Candidatus Bathyarchaeia archaeon]